MFASVKVRTAIFWVVMLGTAVLLWQVVERGRVQEPQRYDLTRFREEVMAGNVRSVTIRNDVAVEGWLADGTRFATTLPSNYPAILDLLTERKVIVDVERSTVPPWLSLVVNAFPFLLIIGFWIVMMRRMKARENGPGGWKQGGGSERQ